MKIITISNLICVLGEIPYCKCKCGNKVNIKSDKNGSYSYYIKHNYPKYINGHSNKNKIVSEESKEKVSKSQKKRFENPKAIEVNRQAQLKRYENPLQKEKSIKSHNTLEYKEKMSKIGKKSYQDNPKRRENVSKGQIKRFKNPKEIEKLRQSKLNNYKNNPEIKEKQQKAAIKRWEKPEEREKQRQSQLHMFSALDHLCKDKYCILFSNKLREQVRIRDNHTCQNCGKHESELIGFMKKHTCHHIHYDKKNCYPDLITLCVSCNAKANFNRNYWESYYMNKLNDRGLLFWVRLQKNIK